MPLRKALPRLLLMNDPARRRTSDLIRDCQRVLVAFSGGIDSTLVLRLAYQELGQNAVALTAVSPSLARSAAARSRCFSAQWCHHAAKATAQSRLPCCERCEPGRTDPSVPPPGPKRLQDL